MKDAAALACSCSLWVPGRCRCRRCCLSSGEGSNMGHLCVRHPTHSRPKSLTCPCQVTGEVSTLFPGRGPLGLAP